jgi:hypothetical protein
MAQAAKKTTASESKEVAVKAPANLPAFLAGYQGPLGNEGIETQDISIPRLKIAQAITQEVKDGDLKEGALFLNVTGQSVWNPGDEPLPAIIVAQAKEYILWRPRKDGGGILARAKPVKEKGVTRYKWDKPNTEFAVKVDGKTPVKWKTAEYIDQDNLDQWGSEIPGNKDSGIAATAHHNYVVVLPTAGNLIVAISMSKSQVRKAKDLNAVLKMVRPDLPISAKVFSIASVDDKNQQGEEYKNWQVKPASEDKLVVSDEALFKFADGVKKGFEQSGFTVDQSGEGGEADEDSGKGRRF